MPPKMRKTRHPGVYQTATGWWIRWTIQVEGVRRDMRQLVHGTLEAAVTLRAQKVEESRRPPPTEPPTLGAYVQSWLRLRAPGMKPSAADSYAIVVSQHILPVLVEGVPLGRCRVDEVRASHLEAWKRYAEQARKAGGALYSAATVAGWWRKVRQLLRDAAAEWHIPDPTLRVRGPRVEGRARVLEQRVPTADEVLALLHHVGEQWHAEVYTAASIGCRAGELYALTWGDVDFTRNYIAIARSHTKGRVGTTKTAKVRMVPMSETLARVLKQHRQQQVRGQHEALGAGLVFPATEDGSGWHRRPSALRNQLARASKAAGLSVVVTPRILRRWANTAMVEGAVDRLVIRDLIGHSSEDMTATYFAASPEAKEAAVVSLAKKIGE